MDLENIRLSWKYYKSKIMDLENIMSIMSNLKIIQVKKYIYILQKYYKSANMDLENIRIEQHLKTQSHD